MVAGAARAMAGLPDGTIDMCGENRPGQPATRAVRHQAGRDRNIVRLGEDMTTLSSLLKRFPFPAQQHFSCRPKTEGRGHPKTAAPFAHLIGNQPANRLVGSPRTPHSTSKKPPS